MVDLIDKLLNTTLFNNCSRADIENILLHTRYRVRKKKAGEYVIRQREEYKELILLIHGEVHTTMMNDNGKEIVIEDAHESFIIGPAFLYARKSIMPVSVIAQEDSEFFYIHRDDFIKLMHSSSTVMINFISIIADKCYFLSRKVNEFATLSLKERAILYFKKRKVITDVTLLSKILGVARPSLSRILHDLKEEGLIVRTEKGLEYRGGK